MTIYIIKHNSDYIKVRFPDVYKRQPTIAEALQVSKPYGHYETKTLQEFLKTSHIVASFTSDDYPELFL